MSYPLAIDRMMNDARTRLPGALDPAIQRELFNVMNEFFQNSNVWQETIALPVKTTATSYELVPLEDGTINRLMWVLDTNSLPANATMQVVGTLVLNTAPSQDTTYYATVAKTVTEPTTKDGFPVAPSWICDKYASSDWIDGVVGRMCSQPAKPYSNQSLSVYHLRRFQDAIATARGESQRNNAFRVQGWRFPQSFAVRTRR